AAPEVESRRRRRPVLGDAANHLCPRRLGQAAQLVQGFLALVPPLSAPPEGPQQRALSRPHSISPSSRAHRATRSATPPGPPAPSTSSQRTSGSRANHVICRLAYRVVSRTISRTASSI